MSDTTVADLEKVALQAAAGELAANESTIVAFIDKELEAGETEIVNAAAGAIKAHVPLIGGTIAGSLSAVGTDFDHTIEGAAKVYFDKLVADVQAKAA